MNGDNTLSPRFAASIATGRGIRLRTAVGLYTQSPGYEKLLQSDYLIDLSSAREQRLRHERATHLVVGIEKAIAADVNFRIEGYYKAFDDLIVGRLETDTERRTRLAAYDFPDTLHESVPTAPVITSSPVNDASGRAYGLDVYLARTDAAARLTGWMSYTWGRAERHSYGRRSMFEYDRRHALNLVGRYGLTSRWILAATARLASGFPYTPPIGLRVAAVENAQGRLVPRTDLDGNLVYSVDYGGVAHLNAGRLPHYARIDLRVTYRRGGATGRWSLYIEVLNLLDRNKRHRARNASPPRPERRGAAARRSAGAGVSTHSDPRVPVSVLTSQSVVKPRVAPRSAVRPLSKARRGKIPAVFDR